MASGLQTSSISDSELVPDSYIPGKSRFEALEITDDKTISEISRKPENYNWENEVRVQVQLA